MLVASPAYSVDIQRICSCYRGWLINKLLLGLLAALHERLQAAFSPFSGIDIVEIQLKASFKTVFIGGAVVFDERLLAMSCQPEAYFFAANQ